MAVGANGHMPKPFDSTKLIEHVKTIAQRIQAKRGHGRSGHLGTSKARGSRAALGASSAILRRRGDPPSLRALGDHA